jgi:hypothetical protein
MEYSITLKFRYVWAEMTPGPGKIQAQEGMELEQ